MGMSKTAVKLQEKLEAARRSLRNKGKDATPTAKGIAVVAGAAIGGAAPMMIGDLSRDTQRYIRLGVGIVLLVAGKRVHGLAPYFGAGVIGAEVAATAIQYASTGSIFTGAAVPVPSIEAGKTVDTVGKRYLPSPEYDFRNVDAQAEQLEGVRA